MLHYIIISVLAVLFGQIVGHLNKKLPPVVAEEITYKEFFSTLFKDFKLDFLYTGIFLVLFNLMVYFLGGSYLIYLYTIVCVALAITFSVDFRYQLIPDEVHILLAIVGVVNFLFNLTLKGLLNQILGAVIGGGIFFLISLLSLLILKKEGMGFGDVKLMAAAGFVLGWKAVIVSLFFGAFAGVIFAIGRKIVSKKEMRGIIPFGPFLAIGVGLCAFVGEVIFNWYLNMFI